MPEQDTLDSRQLAADYGWSLAVLKSDPSLWAVFQKAVKKGWTPGRFIAEVRNTEWFKTHSEAARNYDVLRGSDPATYKAKVNQARSTIRDIAAAMGAQLTDDQLTRISKNVLRFGWNDNQIRDTLAGSVRLSNEGTYGGQAAADAQQLREIARRNGVDLGDTTLASWVQRIAAGEPIDGFEQYVRQTAASAFPQHAERLAAGMDLADLAEPYRQQMARTLELNPEEIDLFDPTLRTALQAVDKEGKPVTKPLWQFERELKQDPRWLYTQNADEVLSRAERRVLVDFGFSY